MIKNFNPDGYLLRDLNKDSRKCEIDQKEQDLYDIFYDELIELHTVNGKLNITEVEIDEIAWEKVKDFK